MICFCTDLLNIFTILLDRVMTIGQYGHMNNIISKLKYGFNYAKAYYPTALPIGLKEAQDWGTDIIQLTGLPDNDSMRFALCMQVLHFKQEAVSHIPKIFFVRSLLKSASNQVMSQIATDLKEKQVAEQKAAQLAATNSSLQVAQDVQQADA